VRHTRERVETLRRVLAGAVVVDEASVAAIGRRVELADDDAEVLEIALVLPGDGDAVRGWVSADAPLGAALLGARAGDTVVVQAPAGRWTARVRAVR
jgi:transcription elongation factor GreA